jgi:hypothetical protein
MGKAIEYLKEVYPIRKTQLNFDKLLHEEILHEAILELSDSIKALTERVDVNERLTVQCDTLLIDMMERVERIERAFFTRTDIKMPPTGPVRFSPVLNDGKAEPDLSQQSPFVTGLSVLDSLKK